MWSLRVEGRRLSIVLGRASLPGGAELGELVVELPHVSFPFDFREGIERFRHHRGVAEDLTLRIDARVVLDWLNVVSGGQVTGQAYDDQLVLAGRTETGTRWTMRARLVPDATGPADGGGREEGEPLLQLSLFGIRAYGPTNEPWPRLAERVIDLLPKELVVDRGLTTARLRCVRVAVAWALSGLGWKLPELGRLEGLGVELREGRFQARFASAPETAGAATRPGRGELFASAGEAEAWEAAPVRGAFERFIEDLELKRHHGQVDRLLGEGRVREALAEVYRALDGPPRPGFLAERLIGICATQPILHDEGERVCRALLEVAPGWEPALVGLAAIALGRGRPEEAAVQLERLLAGLDAASDREDATAADLTLAQILRDFAPEESRAALHRVLERSPDHEEALAELIALAEAEGDVRSALPLYKRLLFAARSKARTREAGLRLARFALLRNEPEDARVLLKVVLEAAPDDLEAQLALADVESQEGNGLEALRILEDALRHIPPSDAASLVKVIAKLARLLLDTLADPARARRVLWRAGDLARVEGKDALELARLALGAKEAVLALRFTELVPSEAAEWAEAQAVRAEAHLGKNDPQSALRAVLGVLEREPDHEGALAMLETSAPDPARREWLVHQLHASARRVAAGEPRARILHRVSRLYESLGLTWDAMAPLSEAVYEATESPRFLPRAERLMELQASFGLWPDHQRVGALRLARLQSLGLADEGAIEARVGLLLGLGRAALDELGDPAGARAFLEEASRLSPRSIDAQELLARALEAELQRGAASSSGTAVAQLAAVMNRLEALRSDDAGRDNARLRLAELQLDRLGSPGQARATLSRLSHFQDARRESLARRAGLTPAPRPAWGDAAPLESSPRAPAPRRDLFAEAVAAADRGDEALAGELLAELLAASPNHVAAAELLEVLAPPAAEPRWAPEFTAEPASARHVANAPAQPFPVAIEAAPEPPSRVAAMLAEARALDRLEDERDARRRGTGTPSADDFDTPAPASQRVVDAKAMEGDRIDEALAEATRAYFEGDLGRARDELEAVLALDPDVVTALELLQEVLGALGDHAARAQVLHKLVETVFDAASTRGYLRLLGDSWDAAGEAAAARDAWVRYLRLDPSDDDLFSRVTASLEAEDDASAHDLLAELHEARAELYGEVADQARPGGDPAAGRALLVAAREHFKADDFEAAAETLDEVLAILGDDPEALDLVVRNELARGRLDAAKGAAKRLLPALLPGAERDWIAHLAS
ncbi:MAG: tetratricopeptide repeat protein [Deltaproteobacteria bacterium]|nr:tetratricopeptide repeat protein [Deltaproteobacteria bacterium]